MAEMKETDQFIVLCGSIVGNMQDGFDVIYDWNQILYDKRSDAIAAGWKERDSNDFNIGVVRGGRLVGFAWMDDPMGTSVDDLREIEAQIGLYEDEVNDAR